jgi:polyisoprenoid-binding protein YceI
MYKIMIVSVVAMGGLLGAVASQETPAAKVETWKIDSVHSSTLFRIQHAGAGRFWGRFNDVTGTVDWPRDNAAAPGFDVIVAVESVDSGNAKLDGHLKSPDFFNAREFETMTCTSTGGERVDDTHWKVTGDLTLLGVTKPATAVIEFTGLRGNPVLAKAGWEAVFEINRSDFGMNWGVDRGALSDDVKIIVALEGGIEPGG